MTELAPIRHEVVVELDAPEAFELFTAHIGDWWPLAEHSVFGKEASVAFEDGRLIESFGDQTSEWGTVTAWEPGQHLSFTWHPGSPAETASAVTVTFATRDRGRTLVVLEHSGWEAFEDPAAARSEYDKGWPTVMGRYGAAAGRDAGETWVALMHRPGPAAPTDGSVFDDPRFADHVSFLSRMREAGYLIAAGPMLDEAGAGMTILRLPGAGRLDEATELARSEDLSVKEGFFEVSVRPWQVVMSP